MQAQRSARRRTHGTGSIIERGVNYYGQWRVDGRLVKRKLGQKRMPGTREGLTKAQAEARLRSLMQEVTAARPAERVTVEEAGQRYIDELRLLGRKPSTIKDYEIIFSRHLVPTLGTKPIDRVTPDEVSGLVRRKLQKGLAASTIHHVLNVLSGIFRYAIERRWASTNPVAAVKRPPAPGPNPDIRFLDTEEFEALLAAVATDKLGSMERVLYMAAGTTGLRQGELVALRWRDVDWLAGVVRVRRTYSRGEWGRPSRDGRAALSRSSIGSRAS
jgi:integrase